MSPEAQRIAIAEACGWKCPEVGGYWKNPMGDEEMLPFYPVDLNAMHEAEKVLNTEQRPIYWRNLSRWVSAANGMMKHAECFYIATATASQRAEAFLRTIGKWDDSK